MTLSREQLEALLKMISLTEDEELTCDECLRGMAEFAETELAGKSLPEGLRAVESHLELCGECREEYEALLQALKDT